MKPPTRRRSAAILIGFALTAAACSTKAGSAGGEQGGVQTGTGVTNDTITLGALTDLHGEFAVAGKASIAGNRIYWKQLNSQGGVCGHKIKLTVKDHGYNVQQAVTLYAQIKDSVLGLEQSLGSPTTTALLDSIKTDKMLTIPASWASTELKNPYIMMVGASYDMEMVNLVDYLVDHGKLHNGDKVGYIYQEGEYGENGLRGGKYAAQQNNITVIPEKIKGSDIDMSAQVTDLKNKGAKAILMTTGPKQVASAAAVAQSLGFTVPILTNSPGWDPGLLNTSAASALEKNLLVAQSWLGPNADNATVKKIVQKVKKSYPNTPLQAQVVWGYGAAQAYAKVLKKACANKNLTRDGVAKAFRSISHLETGGLIAPLDYTQKGAPSARSIYVFRPDKNATGRLKRLTKNFYEGADAKTYVAPAQSSA
ncbi:MAG: ABC transporter substrate-binding protein [Nocardioidaceae bacterium]